ncbi:hypothetical protein HDU76_009744, partial [Blyttiomyces sp. JEL0837]
MLCEAETETKRDPRTAVQPSSTLNAVRTNRIMSLAKDHDNVADSDLFGITQKLSLSSTGRSPGTRTTNQRSSIFGSRPFSGSSATSSQMWSVADALDSSDDESDSECTNRRRQPIQFRIPKVSAMRTNGHFDQKTLEPGPRRFFAPTESTGLEDLFNEALKMEQKSYFTKLWENLSRFGRLRLE